MNVQMSTVAASAGGGGSDASVRSRIQALVKQITTLSKQLQEVAHSDLPAKDKEKQSQLLQARIQLVQAQLAELYRQQAEQAQRRQAEGKTTPASELAPIGTASEPTKIQVAKDPTLLAVA